MAVLNHGGAEAARATAPENDNARGQAGVVNGKHSFNGRDLKASSRTLTEIRCPPAELSSRPMWLMWKLESNGDKKPRKVPFYAHGGRRHGKQGTPEDRMQLTTFDTALYEAMKRGMDGVGFAVLEGSGLTVIDFDNCVGPGGLDPKVEELCAGTYAEFSPSGLGVHAVYEGDLGNRKDAHGEPFGVEAFSSNGYVTFTGYALPGSRDLDLLGREVAPVPEHVRAYCEERFTRAGVSASPSRDPRDDQDPLDTYSPKLGLSIDELRGHLQVLPKDLSYDEWVAVGMGIHHETDGSDEGFLLWDQWSSESPKYTTTEYSREKWGSFGQRGGRLVTVRTLLKLSKEYGGGVAPAAAFDDLAGHPPPGEAPPPTPGQAPTPPTPPPPAPPPTKQLTGDDILRRLASPTAPAFVAGSLDKLDPGRRAAVMASTFPLISAEDLLARPPARWLVKGVVPAAGLAVIFGASGSGKSFLAIDLVAAVAGDADQWFGHRVSQHAPVVFIALEGAAGLPARLRALCDRIGTGWTRRVRFLTVPVSLMASAQIDELAGVIEGAGLAGAMVVVDTLSRAIAGEDENAAETMSKVAETCARLHDRLQGPVLLVHHSGKDPTKGMRGASALHAACDSAIEVRRIGDTSAREWIAAKVKDGTDGTCHGFRLESVPLGLDDDDDVVSSCRVVPMMTATPSPRLLTPAQRLALTTLVQALEGHGRVMAGGARGVHVSDWRRAYYAASTATGDDSKARAFHRARAALVDVGLAEVLDDIYMPVQGVPQ